MASRKYKVLGQSAPAATTLTDVYTVPALTSTVISAVIACNGGAADTIRIAVRPAGAAIAQKHYIAKDYALAANDSVTLGAGLTLDATDVVSVYSANGTTTGFNVYGSEIS